jgi:hypothetical protein
MDNQFLISGVACWILFILVALPPVSAQVFNAGISGGINVSQVEGDGFKGYDKAGGNFGIFVNKGLQQSLRAQLEIKYSSKGSQLPTTIENPKYYKIELHYIEFPILVKYSLSRFEPEAGLSGGYLFHSTEKDEFGQIPNSRPFKKTELAALAGISWFISERLSLNARISYSVLPVREHAGGGTYRFNFGQNNNVISFKLQYQFLAAR